MTYSQSGEDRYLIDKYFNKLYPTGGIYFEAGAMDGIRYSNTKMLEDEHGWTGILVEPHKHNYALLQKNRPNNKLYNCLLGHDGNESEFMYFENANLAAVSGIASSFPENLLKNFYENQSEWFQQQRKDNLKSEVRKNTSLNSVMSESDFNIVNFLSLDVEGHELEVLKSLNWSFKIDFMLIEVNDISTHEFIISNNYFHLEDIANNSFYVHHTLRSQVQAMK